jgi:hypothetical protein
VNADTISKVQELMCAHRRITINEGVNKVGISSGSQEAIMTEELWMKQICAKFVSKLLTDDQRECSNSWS